LQVGRAALLLALAITAARCGARGELGEPNPVGAVDQPAGGRGPAAEASPGTGGTLDANAGGSGAPSSGGVGASAGGAAASGAGGEPSSGGAAAAGGGGGGTLDATVPDGSGSGGGKQLKIPFPDAAAPKDAAGPGYTVVDGGNDCEHENVGAVFAYQSCCNGTLCRGQCVVFDGQTEPVCYCASLVGGCPAPHHCCMGTHCAWADYCN
jgi:hypothetical protein